MSKYVITGTLKNGKRFAPIHTDNPQHYNIWRGTLWRISGKSLRGKELRTKIKEY